MTVLDTPIQAETGAAPPRSTPTHLLMRLVRGRPADRPWVRPSLLALLTTTAVLYIWGLAASGWANSFYTAAVQAGGKSWKAFLFGSFDSSSFITVDKTPAALWVMELSVRVFGFNSWSVLVPEALEGVGTVGLVYLTVRRWFPAGAALVAGAVTALTPVAALMFRFNNPDALMVLLITLSAYATVRLTEDGRTRWALLAGSAVGFAFLAKMLQAFLVVPPLAVVILVAAPGPVRRRLGMLVKGAAALAVSAGWWLALVSLVPASDRPYIGGSTDNSIWNLMFGYNGFGRLDGNETGSVGGGPTGTAGRWGATGLTRLFGAEMGTQVSWLLPAALVLLVAGFVITRRAPRQNRARAALVLWGGWLLVTGAAFSLGKGIIHPYYTVALAPAIGGLIGAGGSLFWVNRERPAARAVLAACVLLTTGWAVVLLRRTPHWMPWLQAAVMVLGVVGAVALVGRPSNVTGVRLFAGGIALVACLLAPTAYTLDTVRTAHSGAIPSAGPAGSSTGGFPGPGGGPVGRHFAGAPAGGGPGGPFAAGPGGGFPGTGGGFPGGPGGAGSINGANSGALNNGGFPGGAARGSAGGTAGGLLNASRPSAAVKALLDAGAAKYEWVAATVGANSAAGYQIATGHAVMAIGGFNGTDPYPSLPYFENLVASGKIHYFIASGGGFGGPGGGTSSVSTAITSWVQSHFSATTVGGVTLYDLTGTR